MEEKGGGEKQRLLSGLQHLTRAASGNCLSSVCPACLASLAAQLGGGGLTLTSKPSGQLLPTSEPRCSIGRG